MAKGCEWNNQLAKENFQTNLKEHGLEYAKQTLRTDIHHWVAKREGREVPKWRATLDQDGHFVAEGQRLVDLTKAPVDKKVDAPISEEVKALVPIELETVLQAEKQASQGAKKIYMPEHAPGGIRFITVYTQSTNNPREYIGSQIDLGENLTWDQAKERMQTIGEAKTKQIHQSSLHEEAFVFVEQSGNSTGVYQKSMVDFIAREAVTVPRRIITDVTSTAISAGAFAMEVLRRRRAQNQLREKEMKNVKHKKDLLITKQKLSKERKKKKQIEKAHKVIAMSHSVFETGVGVSGSIVFLRQLAEMPKIVIRESMQSKKKKNEVKPEHRTKKTRIETAKKEKKLMRKRTEIPKRIGKKENKKRIFKRETRIRAEMKPEAKKSKKKEKKQIVLRNLEKKREIVLWKMLPRLVRRIEKTRPGKEVIKKEKKQFGRRLALAWVLWLLLRDNRDLKQRIEASIDRYKKERPKSRKPRELTRWILLAIIWHLVMIRERAMPTVNKKQKKRTQKNIFQAKIPPRGVIFAFAS